MLIRIKRVMEQPLYAWTTQSRIARHLVSWERCSRDQNGSGKDSSFLKMFLFAEHVILYFLDSSQNSTYIEPEIPPGITQCHSRRFKFQQSKAWTRWHEVLDFVRFSWFVSVLSGPGATRSDEEVLLLPRQWSKISPFTSQHLLTSQGQTRGTGRVLWAYIAEDGLSPENTRIT